MRKWVRGEGGVWYKWRVYESVLVGMGLEQSSYMFMFMYPVSNSTTTVGTSSRPAPCLSWPA